MAKGYGSGSGTGYRIGGAWLRLLLLSLVVVTVFGQTQSVTAPPSNPKPADPNNPAITLPSAEKNAAGSAPASEAGVDIHKYIIGAQDVLYVQVWREPDFTRQVVVRPDGKISIPLIGEVEAAGLTPEQCAGKVRQGLTKLINNPDVSISVLSINSKRYFIDGEVYRPGLYRLVTPTTVLEALSEAGGFRDFANTKKIRILRGDQTLRFNYKEVSHGKNMSQNVYLQNGDHIIVP
jgi:polysaccharide export outer membrane protein